ncbi:MAG: hypothetical protein H6907_19270 [Hyphomicrobiales bacterium]|nr:hypothetical protein [Hyphomicrobiales bacterium]
MAIARALAVEPEVLLLTSPRRLLDLKRQHMRTELRAIQQRVGITSSTSPTTRRGLTRCPTASPS